MSIKNRENPNSDHGLAVIIGTRYHVDNSEFLKLETAINNNNFLNIMLIEFDDQKFNQNELTNTLQLFMLKNSKTTVIIAIHGAEVFRGSDHYSIIGKNVDNSLFNFMGESISNFLHGNVVRSSLILEAIGNAAKLNSANQKELNIWQYSCQDSKLIGAAQKYLPYGTKYVAESEGFIYPEFFLNTIVQELKANREFSFDELYLNYLAMSDNFGYSSRGMEPVKFIIGEKPVKSIEKADKLLKEIKFDLFDKGKFTIAKNKHCQKVAIADHWMINEELPFYSKYTSHFCMKPANQLLEEYFIHSKEVLSFSSCIDKSNQASFIEYNINELIKDILYLLGSKTYYNIPVDCILQVGAPTIEAFQGVSEHYYNEFQGI